MLSRNDIKNLDRSVDTLMKEQKFQEAVQQLKQADILLNGPLSVIEGLTQLRTKVMDLSQVTACAFIQLVCRRSFKRSPKSC